ncbi:endonuclease/exonuclease/phosphatase family protein [Gillisia limnaea]|uniref:Endonuclease/exonuclease/phosphatase n=1 Tax=Gillisia limnaea (strain DSM 15749 / LMG 21470 / R-8282) TaxID=865937 RepID=H2BVV5_GILLR|nr:endonuclease/exonuclease/phosphatase family protein [Gillisia limnaea]EHQ01831.1 Endonuclease/exonuclease/phosphatase [Gillisia limnaea DSM 15749]EHQ01838.1 Endonuclease/exonuclease/phosphatase [Gillisia limnaea DSM 15749]
MNFRKVFLYFVIVLSCLVILASLLSLLYNLPFWYSKLLDFPRLQYLILATVFLLLFVGLAKKWKWPSILLVSGLVAAIAIQSVVIFPYWFGEKAVPDAGKNYSEDNSVSILLANVLISNRESEKFLNVVRESDPDLVLAMEVNQWWMDELEILKKNYPYVIEQPNEEAYGMALYSKFPLLDEQVKYLKHKDVPSFHARVQLNSGKEFLFHGVHPVAPMPSDKYPDNVGEGEVALLKVGNFVAEEEIPSMVAGDFNDVSWSRTARLFGSSGNLKNVRLGRGIYSSFDANSRIMRWPLDHYFVTEEFQVVALRRLSKIGSDHFPVYAKFVLVE